MWSGGGWPASYRSATSSSIVSSRWSTNPKRCMSTSSLLDAISAGWNEAWLPAPKRRPRELSALRCIEQNGNTAGGLRWLAVPVMNRPSNESSRLAGWTVENHLDAPPVTAFLQETRFYSREAGSRPQGAVGGAVHSIKSGRY